MPEDNIRSQGYLTDYTRSSCSLPEVRDLIRKFDVPAGPIDEIFFRGEDTGSLDHGIHWWHPASNDHRLFRYGARYRVLRTINPNRSGRLIAGEIVTSLGNYVFPYDNGLRLFFEFDDRRKIALEFEGIRETPNRMSSWSVDDFDTYLEHMPDRPRNGQLRWLAIMVVRWARRIGPTPRFYPYFMQDAEPDPGAV